jgi:hypothetical protein
VPGVAPAATLTVSVEEADEFGDGVTGFVPKLQVSGAAQAALSVTAELKPASEVTVTLAAEPELLPAAIVSGDGLSPMLKSGGTGTVTVTPVECTRLPAVPVMVFA